jgi:methylmalonyl-CoA mutase
MEEALTAKDSVKIPALQQVRLGQDFERLRDLGDAYAAKYGERPKMFLANVGTIAEFTARATFAKNFFEAIASDFKRCKTHMAVVCGTDALYGEHLATVAKALRAAGASLVYMAGRPADPDSGLKLLGVDGFIMMGSDVVATLNDIYKHVEAA